MKRPYRVKNIAGLQVGRLFVIRFVGLDKKHASLWECQCLCGRKTKATGPRLRAGHTRSCGCLFQESAAANRFKHGDALSSGATAEYRCWSAMIQRCHNSKSSAYKNYGGRGIEVCERWRTYPNFLADMGRKPSPTLTIDRINNDGNYEPGNCRWATRSEQQRNTRVQLVVRKQCLVCKRKTGHIKGSDPAFGMCRHCGNKRPLNVKRLAVARSIGQ